jgi:hypothetical protein
MAQYKRRDAGAIDGIEKFIVFTKIIWLILKFKD